MGVRDWLARVRGRRVEPGEECPCSGQWTWSQEPHSQVTCVEGKIMPPPPRGQKDGFWKLTDVTKHKGGIVSRE